MSTAPAYDPATAATALQTAIDALKPVRKAARDGDAPQAAAIIDGAINDLQVRRRQIDAASTALKYSPRHAADVLNTAGRPTLYDEVDYVAIVRLTSDRYLRITPLAAQTGGRDDGYVVDVVAGGVSVLILHADTDDDLVALVGAMIRAN